MKTTPTASKVLRGLSLLVALSSFAACADQALQPAQLNQVCLADGSGDCQAWTWAGQESRLLLLGTHLAPVFEVDLGDDGLPEGAGFHAWMGQQELTDINITTPVNGQQSALTATLPAGLAPGTYALDLTSPSGQIQSLEEAFELRSPLTAELSIEKTILPVDDSSVFSLHLRNSGSATLRQVHLEWEQTGAGQVDLPGSLDFDELIPGAQQDVQVELLASTAGRCSLRLWAAAQSEFGVPLRQEPGLSIELAVLEAASLTMSADLQPNPAAIDQIIVLEAEVHNEGGVGLSQVELVIEQDGSGAQLEWDPAPEGVSLLAGGQRFLRRQAVVRGAGQARLQIRAQGIEDISGTLRQSAPTASIVVDATP